MRSLTILLALFAFDAGVQAQDSDRIQWSSARPLSWTDFASPIPRTIDEERVAATTAAIPWSYKYTVEMSSTQCEYTITEILSNAYFLPDSSWVRPNHRNPEILRHEQGHFDIAHIYSEEFMAQTRELVNRRGDCRGRNKRAAARFSEERIAEIVGSVFESVWTRYRAHQDTYDRETKHGTDLAEQARWTADIAAAVGRIE